MTTSYTSKVTGGAVAPKKSEKDTYWEKFHKELTKKNKKKIEKLDFEKKSTKWIISYRSQMFEDDCEEIFDVLAIVDTESEHNINDIFANFVLDYVINKNKLSSDLLFTIGTALGKYDDEVEFHILLEKIVANEKEHDKLLDVIHQMIKTDKKKTELTISINDLDLGFKTATISCKKYTDIECVPKIANVGVTPKK